MFPDISYSGHGGHERWLGPIQRTPPEELITATGRGVRAAGTGCSRLAGASAP